MTIQDRAVTLDVTSRSVVYEGRVWDIVHDSFVFPETGEVLGRDYIDHPGAVAVVALDDDDRILMIEQYRHPVSMYLWEVPAGLLDIDGEDPVTAAERELFEEADVRADTWHVLVDQFNSPGASAEALRIFLAQGIHEIPEDQRHVRDGEEASMKIEWVPFGEALTAVIEGRIHNPSAVSGIMALAVARQRGMETLRDAHVEWNAHPKFRAEATNLYRD
ncbi:NUDIX domain-containing protein [Neomicrococcus lactis]